VSLVVIGFNPARVFGVLHPIPQPHLYVYFINQLLTLVETVVHRRAFNPAFLKLYQKDTEAYIVYVLTGLSPEVRFNLFSLKKI
jgi:hypothetical protein